MCAETEADVEERLGWIEDHYRPFVDADRLERVKALWRDMSGTPEQLVEKLRPWEAAGMTYAIAFFVDVAYDTGGLELFAREVIPALS